MLWDPDSADPVIARFPDFVRGPFQWLADAGFRECSVQAGWVEYARGEVHVAVFVVAAHNGAAKFVAFALGSPEGIHLGGSRSSLDLIAAYRTTLGDATALSEEELQPRSYPARDLVMLEESATRLAAVVRALVAPILDDPGVLPKLAAFSDERAMHNTRDIQIRAAARRADP